MTRRSYRGRALRAGAVVLAAALASGCGKTAPRGTESVASSLAAIVATCAAVVGDVQVRPAGQDAWAAVTTGAVLRNGDTIRTGAGAFVRVAFVSGNGIELEESTTAVVDVTAPAIAAAGVPVATERVALARGVARGWFPGTSSGDPARALVVRTADGGEARLSAAAGQQGVRFRLTATATGTEIAVTDGSASVASPAGAVSLDAGHAVDVARAGVGVPVELIAFPRSLRPGVDARFPLGVALRVELAWERLDAASGYRVQIARDLSFREVLHARDVTAPELVFTPPAEGLYAWRVAARDAAGRQGEYGFARRVYVDAAPARDLLVTPAPDAVLRANPGLPVRFAWSDDVKGRRYRVVIASAPELTEQPLRSETTADASVELGGLAPGVYYWGVYVDDERRDPLFVAPRRLVVQATPEGRVKVQKSVNEWGR